MAVAEIGYCSLAAFGVESSLDLQGNCAAYVFVVAGMLVDVDFGEAFGVVVMKKE